MTLVLIVGESPVQGRRFGFGMFRLPICRISASSEFSALLLHFYYDINYFIQEKSFYLMIYVFQSVNIFCNYVTVRIQLLDCCSQLSLSDCLNGLMNRAIKLSCSLLVTIGFVIAICHLYFCEHQIHFHGEVFNTSLVLQPDLN